MLASFLGSSGIAADDRAFPICYAVRHLTRVYNILRKTGAPPSRRNWHVRQFRLAVEEPESILGLIRSVESPSD